MASPEQLSILVVEDSRAMRGFLEKLLRARGHDVAGFPDGETAWEAVQQRTFDLAILDWTLPGKIEGLDLCRRMRAMRDGNQTMILLLTARSGKGDFEATLEAGADDYLAKPLEPEVLSLRLAIAERHARVRREMYRAQRELEHANARSKAIVEAAAEGIITIDERGTVLSYNAAAHALFGHPPEDVVGQNVSMLMPPRDREQHDSYLARYRETGEKRIIGVGRDVKGQRKDGTIFPLHLALSEVSSQDAVTFVGVIHDLTERKRVEGQLREARDQALAGARAKSEFLATVSHEIRTPMNGILGMLELVLATPLSVEQLDHLTTARLSAESLLGLLNALLDFSKIEGGELELDVAEFMLEDVIADAVRIATPATSGKDVTVHAAVDPALPRRMRGDSARLRQILLSLVLNGVKFTEKGSVSVRAEHAPGSPEKSRLHLSVVDTGIGIPAEKSANLFSSFSQVDGSTTRRHGGLGLGLAICKRLVDLMGGEIGFESRVGEGSRFWINVPCAPVAGGGAPAPAAVAPKAAAAPDTSAERVRVLVVEDNPVNQTVAKRMLERLGAEVSLAANGREGVDAWAESPYDLIFMDLHMPEMDGLEAAAEIRNRESLGRRTPIVALTASVLPADRARCFEIGMDDFLTKPIRVDALREAIGRWARRSADAAPAAEPSAPSAA